METGRVGDGEIGGEAGREYVGAMAGKYDESMTGQTC